jgi:hypothetical protein
MKITKLPHACIIIQENDSRIVIDPSTFFEFDQDFPTPENIVATIFTHSHYDHYDPKNLAKLLAKNPKMQILASADTAKTIAQDLPKVQATVAKPGETQKIANFSLEFFGGRHAPVDGKDRGDNVGIVANRELVYPGDSFDFPPADSVDETCILALPTSGPWLKIGDSVNYLRNFAKNIRSPEIVFATHDALNTPESSAKIANQLHAICDEIGTKFMELKVSENLEI